MSVEKRVAIGTSVTTQPETSNSKSKAMPSDFRADKAAAKIKRWLGDFNLLRSCPKVKVHARDVCGRWTLQKRVAASR